MQGIFTLENGLSVQTLLHVAGAIAFVLGTMWHADASNALFTDIGDTALAVSPAARAAISMRRMCSDSLPVMLFMVPLGLHLWHWSGGFEGKGMRLQNVICLAQWVLVLNFAVFYCTYALDFWVVLEQG